MLAREIGLDDVHDAGVPPTPGALLD